MQPKPWHDGFTNHPSLLWSVRPSLRPQLKNKQCIFMKFLFLNARVVHTIPILHEPMYNQIGISKVFSGKVEQLYKNGSSRYIPLKFTYFPFYFPDWPPILARWIICHVKTKVFFISMVYKWTCRPVDPVSFTTDLSLMCGKWSRVWSKLDTRLRLKTSS